MTGAVMCRNTAVEACDVTSTPNDGMYARVCARPMASVILGILVQSNRWKCTSKHGLIGKNVHAPRRSYTRHATRF